MSIFGFIAELFMEDTCQQEMMRHMSDPYENPGTDLVVDESYHGIDHGMGIVTPEHSFEHTDDSFFGGLADSLFGGSDDGLFGGSDDNLFGGGFGGDDFL